MKNCSFFGRCGVDLKKKKYIPTKIQNQQHKSTISAAVGTNDNVIGT